MVEIGALARHASAERSTEIARHAPLIARAMPHIAHPAIRNRGTIGGSLAYADPAAELPACLLALDGEVDIVGPHGKRSVKADDFFKGLFETALGPHDVLTAVRFPGGDRRHARRLCRTRAPPRRLRDCRAGRLRESERRGACATCGWPISASAQRPCARARPKPRSRAATIDAAVRALDLDPPDDIQATGAVKKHLAGVLLRRVAAQLQEPRA